MNRYYNKRKEETRQDAIFWQIQASQKCYSYLELMKWGSYFMKLAKRYGLMKEFKENGII